MNYLYKRTKSITRWAIKHWPLMTSNVTEKELLTIMVGLFAPEIEHIDAYYRYQRNADGFLRDRMRDTYFRCQTGNRYGNKPHEQVHTLAEYYANCFINLFEPVFAAEMEIRAKAKALDEKISTCSKCQCHYIQSDQAQYETIDGYVKGMCGPCFQREYLMCAGCKTYHERRNMVQGLLVEGNRYGTSVCRDCYPKYVKCGRCNMHFLPENGFDVQGHPLKICKRCHDHLYHECALCGDTFSIMDRCDGWDHEYEYCDPCLMKTVAYHSYKFKPTEYLFQSVKGEKVTPDTLYLGIELEFEINPDRIHRKSLALSLKRIFGWKNYYMVHDGSLNYGLEVVPMPFTERWYHKKRAWLKDMYDTITAKGGSFTGRKVGFHVHTSSAAWEKSQVYKLVKFIYKGGLENASEFQMIYGRNSNRYCQYNDCEYSNAMMVAKGKKNYDDGHHYNALNFSTGSTIEFRMFAGPATFDEMLMRIDFVLSCHQFTRENGFSDMNMNGYIKFLNRNPSQYFRILNHLRKGGCSCV